jgi:hypothetical protein
MSARRLAHNINHDMRGLCQAMKQRLQRLLPPRIAFPPARRRCDMVIVSAASDGEWLGVEELLDSLSTYLDCNYEVVIADDATADGTYQRLLDAGCWVVRNPEKMFLTGLNLTLRRAFIEAHRLFDAPIYLKIDPDALVIGSGLPQAIKAAFDADSTVGLLGTYRIDWNGENRDLSYWRDRMTRRRKDFGQAIDAAEKNGYQTGEGVQGGAYAVSSACLEQIIRNGWMHGRRGYAPSTVKGLQVAEDSLMTMLVYAAGYRAEDFGGPGQPFGIWDVGLPMPPAELVRQNRLVTHAMKYQDTDSLDAREFFRARRSKHKQMHPE